jgi:hypothetical protein
VPASVNQSQPWSNSNAASVLRLQSFGFLTSQCRPAIRDHQMQHQPEILLEADGDPLSARRISRTVFSKVAPSEGSAERIRNGDLTMARTNLRPTIRFCNKST